MHTENIDKALLSNNPIETLRLYAIKLNEKGLDKNEIYEIFYKYYIGLEKSNIVNQKNEDILGDVMDMITGWFVGNNLNLK